MIEVSLDVLKSAMEASCDSVPLRRLYAVHSEVFGPQNLLACATFQPKLQRSEGRGSMAPQWPWTVSVVRSQATLHAPAPAVLQVYHAWWSPGSRLGELDFRSCA